MNLTNLVEENIYSSNKQIDNYIKKLDKLAVISDGSSLASVTSFKLNIMRNENFFKQIELLKSKNVNGFENYEIPSESPYGICNYNINFVRYILTKQIYLLNFDKNDDNFIKYINSLDYLASFFSEKWWEKHFIETIIASTMFDTMKSTNDKNKILNNFVENTDFIKNIQKLLLSDNKSAPIINNEILSNPKENSYYNMIKYDKNFIDNKNASKQNNLKDVAVEASYPYLFFNFTHLFTSDLKKEIINKMNQNKLNLLMKKYQETKSPAILAELSKISQNIM